MNPRTGGTRTTTRGSDGPPAVLGGRWPVVARVAAASVLVGKPRNGEVLHKISPVTLLVTISYRSPDRVRLVRQRERQHYLLAET